MAGKATGKAKQSGSGAPLPGDYRRTQVYAEVDLSKPKHAFQVIARRIRAAVGARSRFSLLDVGGASGAFCHYLASVFPRAELHCLEFDPRLVAEGKRRVAGCTFHRGDARNMRAMPAGAFDVVTCLGVLSIFDDFAKPLRECLRVARSGGSVFVLSPFNEYPVDARIRYRYSGAASWNTGYNLISRRTCEEFLRSRTEAASWGFRRFTLPFDLAPQADPIRSWTEKDGEGRRRFVNGLNLILDLQILAIRVA